MQELLISNVSYSQIGKMLRDPGDWANSYLLNNWDNTTGVAAAAGTVAHKFVEHLIRTKGDTTAATNAAYSCIYEYEGQVFIIDVDNFDDDVKNLDPERVLSDYKTKVVDFGKKSMEVLLKKIKGGISGYLNEKIHYGDIVAVEPKLEHTIKEQILDTVFTSPVPFKAIPDIVCRSTQPLQLVDSNNEIVTVPAGSLYIEDNKFSDKFKELNKDSGAFFFQAMFLYYVCKKEYGEAPTHINFRVIKTSANRDGSSQQQVVTFLFVGDEFEVAKTDFWRYIMRYFELVEFYSNGDVIYNVFDFINGDDAWAKQRAYYRQIPVDQLKQAISVTSRNKAGKNKFGEHEFNFLDKGKKIEAGETFNPNDIEDVIKAKYLEYGIPLKFEKQNEGYAYNQLLFTPGRGVTMGNVAQKFKEIQLATGIENLRIEAPVTGTKYIGIEYPRDERKFLKYSNYTVKKRGLKVPIGKDIFNKTYEIDFTDASYPHLLIAGTTGSGKSELMKTIITSLVGKCDLTLIDPKMVEFAEFEEDVKHYITEASDVDYYLDVLSYEMNKIYKLLKSKKVTNIDDYNKKTRNKKDKLQHKIIIMDEFGDLRLDPDFGDTIERNIQRLAAKGRAAGIHLVIATQRPDVKTINGTIKNNITTRVCLKVASSIDSQVVLGKAGAENLLGKGDLLFQDNTITKRLQGFYIG